LDINLPDYDGFEVCKKIRSKSGVPILFVSSDGDIQTRLYAYDVGADGFLIKPVDLRELTAIVKVLLRRVSQIPTLSPKYSAIKIDPANDSLIYKNTPINFTKSEYTIFHLLINNRHKTLSREHISQTLAYKNSLNSINYHIKNIRRKLVSTGAPSDTIVSAYEEGYRVNI